MRSPRILIFLMLLLAAVLFTACQSPVVEVTRVVTESETVTEQIEVTRIVEGETITELVEVTATPTARGGQVVLGTNKFPSGMDPHREVAWEILYVLSAVYDTLVYQNEAGEFVPGLATSWDVSDDGQTYTFQLREGVTFHDGTPFNAEAAKYNFDRMVAPDTRSQKAAGLLGPYESSEVIDEYTIQVNLSESYSPLLEGLSLTYTGMASPTAIEEWGEEYQLHQVGTGPFIFQEYNPESHLTLVANPDYAWGPEIFENQGTPYLEEVRWIFLPESASRLPALEAGDVDIALSFPPSDANQLLSQPDLDLRITNLIGQPLYWFMNVERSPTDDIRVRQALLHGLDRQTAVNIVLRGFYPVATGPLTAVTTDYNPAVADVYPYDLERANALLEEAGWVDSDGDGIRERDGQPLTIDMVLQSWGEIAPLGEVLQAQMRELGIQVEAELLSWPAQLEVGTSGEANMTVMGGSGFFADDSLRGFFHSDNIENGFSWSRLRSDELDGLLEAGARATNPEERKEIYDQVQTLIMDEALILPVYDYVFMTGFNTRVKDVKWSRTGLVPYLNDAYVDG